MTLQCLCCGVPLTADFTRTQPLEQMLAQRSQSKWGTARFSSGMCLRLTALALGKSLRVKPDGGESVIGRRDPDTGDAPQVDLEPFEAWRRGVSRRHALLRWREGRSLVLVDLGSSNGTFLNGQRLNPHEERIVRDGDEIRIGQLGLWVTFENDPITGTDTVVGTDAAAADGGQPIARTDAITGTDTVVGTDAGSKIDTQDTPRTPSD